MMIDEFENKITELTADEYFFLTENLESTDSISAKNGVKYLVINKRKRLAEIVNEVLDNELEETEKNIAVDYWGNEISANKIAEKYHMSRSAVYRSIDSARKKILRSLKYVLLYDKTSLPRSAEELLNYVNKREKAN